MDSMFCFILLYYFGIVKSHSQTGPDPWNYDIEPAYTELKVPSENLPLDIKRISKYDSSCNKGSATIGEWSFRRIIAIFINDNRAQKNEDGTIDISTHLKFNAERWKMLNKYLNMDEPFSEEVIRRILGYIEEAIVSPKHSIAEKIIMTYNEYIQIYVVEYKMQIIYTLITLSIVGFIIWIWKNVKLLRWFIIPLAIYFYEAVISYKEAEQEEVDKFLKAIDSCKWQFWTQECAVPKPDWVLFLKHMHPLKIFVRMFFVFISEPLVVICETVDRILHNITDGLWFPLGEIVRGLLMVFAVIMLLYFLFQAMSNFVFRFPLSLVIQRLTTSSETKTSCLSHKNELQTSENERLEIIQPDTIHKILDVCARALDTATNNNRPDQKLPKNTRPTPIFSGIPQIRRSASTGRLPSYVSDNSDVSLNRTRTNYFAIDASGDH